MLSLFFPLLIYYICIKYASLSLSSIYLIAMSDNFGSMVMTLVAITKATVEWTTGLSSLSRVEEFLQYELKKDDNKKKRSEINENSGNSIMIKNGNFYWEEPLKENKKIRDYDDDDS